jgi:hypothetical protein
MIQLCLGQSFLHLGRRRDVSSEFFNLHQQGTKGVCLYRYETARGVGVGMRIRTL